ncbi:MAG: hypothetical protein E7393_06045 [Ruminococcaceae bacterium]|nr:hypothetical protein [Oscillospiraceae bacterium]
MWVLYLVNNRYVYKCTTYREATNTETKEVSKSWIRRSFEQLFDAQGGQKQVSVQGVAMDGEPYIVSVGKRAVRKVISDPNLSAEKLAVLESIENVIANAEYVGSGKYVPKEGVKPKNVTRYDYFETPASINGQDYIVAFDVEVFPQGNNNYRTHKVINEMDLTPISGTDDAPVASAAEMALSPSINSIPQNAENSNKNFVESKEKGQAQAFGEAQRVFEDADSYGVGDDLRQEKVRDSERDIVNRMGENLKRKIVWYDPATEPENADADGYYVNGEIRINEYAKDPAAVVFGHEVFHSLPEADKIALIDLFKEHVNQNSAAFQSYKTSLDNKYKARYAKEGRNFTEDDFWEEFAAKNMGTFFGDESFVNKLARENSGFAQRILNAIRDFFDKVGGFFSPKSYTGRVSEATEVGGFSDATLRKAERMLEKALNQQMKSPSYAEKAEAKFSYIGKTKSGIRKYKSDFPVDMPMDDRIGLFKKRISTIFNLGVVELQTDTKKIKVLGDKFTFKKNMFGDEVSTPLEASARINSLYDLSDILSHSKYVGKEIEPSYADSNVAPKNDAHKGVKYWYKFKNTIYFDGIKYDVTFSIRDKGKEQYEYFIDFKTKEDGSNQPYSQKDLRLALDEPSSSYSIPNFHEKVNTKSSTNRESSGKPLYNLTDGDLERSAFYDNLQEAETVEDAVKRMVDDNIDLFTYEPITNEETMVKAVQEVMAEPGREALRFLGLTQGVLCASASVHVNQLVKQAGKSE